MISLVCYQKSKQQHWIINRKPEVATFFKFVYTYLNSLVCFQKSILTHLKHGLTSCGARVWSPDKGGPIKWTFGLYFFFLLFNHNRYFQWEYRSRKTYLQLEVPCISFIKIYLSILCILNYNHYLHYSCLLYTSPSPRD